MSYCITYAELRAVLGAHTNSLTNWTRGLPRRRGEGENAPQFLRLTDLIACLRQKRRYGLKGGELRSVCDLDGPFDPSQPLGSDAVERGQALREVLTPAEIERLDRVTADLCKAAAWAFFDRYVYVDRDSFIAMLPLCRPVLRYVLLRDRSELGCTRQERADLAAAVIRANSDPETIKNLSSKKQTAGEENV